MKFLLKTFLILALASFLFTNCSKEVRLANKIEGVWDITIYTIDGEDELADHSSFTFTFAEYDNDASEGSVIFETVDIDNTTDIDTEFYDYQLSEDATALAFIDDDDRYEFDIELSRNNMTLKGILDGEVYVFEATKK